MFEKSHTHTRTRAHSVLQFWFYCLTNYVLWVLFYGFMVRFILLIPALKGLEVQQSDEIWSRQTTSKIHHRLWGRTENSNHRLTTVFQKAKNWLLYTFYGIIFTAMCACQSSNTAENMNIFLIKIPNCNFLNICIRLELCNKLIPFCNDSFQLCKNLIHL